MPLYDQNCINCGVHEVFCHKEERHNCRKCGEPCARIPGVMHSHGIIWANAETNKQLGVTWNTNEEKRQWLKKHPNAVPMEKGSKEDRDFKQAIRDKADKVLKHHGYNDHQHFKKEAKKKQVLGASDGK